MTKLSAFKSFTSGLAEQAQLTPVLFVGHGSPMNGIEDTEFSRRWIKMAKVMQDLKAWLEISKQRNRRRTADFYAVEERL